MGVTDVGEAGRKAAYEAWAARMRSRRDGPIGAPAEPDLEPQSTAGYWSTESLFRDSELDRQRTLEDQKRQRHINSLLATLDLPPGSSLKDCSDRVKKLARQLHPDMNLEKSTRSGKIQLDRMVEINAAYEELKHLL